MLRGLIRFVLLAVSTFFAPATGPTTYWQFHRQMDRNWDVSDEECDAAIKALPTHYAYTQFFVQSGGNNANSGTSSTNTITWSNVASVVWTGTTTSTLATTDTTATAVQVGDYINVGGGWISQVTANSGNVGGTVTITLSGTTGWGSEPSNQTYSTNGKVVDGGAWANYSQAVLTSGANVPSSTMICSNVSYTLSGNLNFFLNGAPTTPVWWRAYNTILGDLDAGSTVLSYPTLTIGTNVFAVDGGYVTCSGFSFTSAHSGAAVTSTTTGPVRFYRCQFANTSSNAAATAFSSVGVASFTVFTACSFTAPSTATTIINTTSGGNGPLLLHSCYIAGNGGSTTSGITVAASGDQLICLNCTFTNLGLYGIYQAGGNVTLLVNSCTFNTCGSDSIHIAVSVTGASATALMIANCAFFKSGGFDINNATGTNICGFVLANNLSYSSTSGHMSGFGNYQEFGTSPVPVAGAAAFVDLSNPLVSSTDFHLLATSVGAGAGLPGQWENQTAGLTSTPDVGAWQRAVSGGGGGVSGARIFTGF